MKKLVLMEVLEETEDTRRSRIEVRECIISKETSWLQNRTDRSNFYGIGAIYCTVEKDGVTSKQSHYFIYSCKSLNANKQFKCLPDSSYLNKILVNWFCS